MKNVLLYARDPSEGPKHVAAGQWVEQLWNDGNGRTSVQQGIADAGVNPDDARGL